MNGEIKHTEQRIVGDRGITVTCTGRGRRGRRRRRRAENRLREEKPRLKIHPLWWRSLPRSGRAKRGEAEAEAATMAVRPRKEKKGKEGEGK